MTTPLGSHDVVVSEELPIDGASRASALPVIAVYPAAGPGPFPLIVFSHGLGGEARRVLDLPKYWASHGYVCLLPTHVDSIRREPRGGSADRLRIAESRIELAQLLQRTRGHEPDFLDRPKDVTFLLDFLDSLVAAIPVLDGRIDTTRIGVGGHSIGAYSAQLIGGAVVRTSRGGPVVGLRDERVGAILLISPQGAGRLGLSEDSWSELRLPMMSLSGSLDYGADGESPEWRMDPFRCAQPGRKYHIVVRGASHDFFGARRERPTRPTHSARLERLRNRLRPGERAGAEALRRELFESVERATLLFWDAHLKGEPGALSSLASDGVAAASNGLLEFERR